MTSAGQIEDWRRCRAHLGGKLEELQTHRLERGRGDDRGVLQGRTIPALLGEVEPYSISAQAFVGTKFADGELGCVSKILESLSHDDSHFHFPAHAGGAICARGKLGIVRDAHSTGKCIPQTNYGYARVPFLDRVEFSENKLHALREICP